MTAFSSNLFELPPMPRIAHPVKPPPASGFALRDYQGEDVDATQSAWEAGKRAVVCREATGLGKSIYIAECARRASAGGRVLIIVDVTNLADDLVRTISKHTDKTPGVLTGGVKEGWQRRRIVVATVQTLYSGKAGEEWYRQLNPMDFAAVLIDECETSIADRYSGVLRYFKDGNPQLVMAGCTATPFRGDGRGMGEIFDHAADQPGPLNRDILWGRDNGWLVHIRQGFVRVSLDFSTLKLKKDDDGIKDYTDSDLVKMFDEEKPLVELAKGIHKVAQGMPSIVICPNNVEFAKKLSHYLDAEQRGCSNAIYGEQGRRATDLIDAHKRGAYPYAVSVNKLYKGYDFCGVRFVFMCRKTRSRRLYEQALGRGSRPLSEIRDSLNSSVCADVRRSIIAASAKPWMVMVDMVGVHPLAKDLGVIDILGSSVSDKARENAKQKMMDEPDAVHETESVASDAQKKLDEEAKREFDRKRAEAARVRDRIERDRRRRLSIESHIDVEITDDFRVSGASVTPLKVPGLPATDGQVARLVNRLRWPEALARKLTKKQASGVIAGDKKYTPPKGDKPALFEKPAQMTPAAFAPVSPWQRDQLARLGHAGPLPANHAAAKQRINELSGQRRVSA